MADILQPEAEKPAATTQGRHKPPVEGLATVATGVPDQAAHVVTRHANPDAVRARALDSVCTRPECQRAQREQDEIEARR